jgi:hypothetical protein
MSAYRMKKKDDMKQLKNVILPILLATVWISISEFIRNEFLLKTFWTEHYKGLGLIFPSGSVNGAVWGIWSLLFAIAIFIIVSKFTLLQTTFLSWFIAFVMMWLALGNLGVLPYGLLLYAIPLSFIESFLAALIIIKFHKK